MKTIKRIETKNFAVELTEVERGYVIFYTTAFIDKTSELLKDFGLASYLFDLKVQELEGQ